MAAEGRGAPSPESPHSGRGRCMKAATIVLASLLAVSVLANAVLLLNGGQGKDERDGAPNYVANAVFIGKVVDIRAGHGADETVTFRIAKIIKQEAWRGMDLGHGELVDVVSDGELPGCFFNFGQDRVYTVHAMLDESGALVTSACRGTHPYGGGG